MGEDKDSLQFDEWMEKFFLDPYTTLLDEMTFRIDVYDTSDAYIIEALLDQQKPSYIEVTLLHQDVNILIETISTGMTKPTRLERKVPFPFSLQGKQATAEFANDILLITIGKTEHKSKNPSTLTLKL